MRRCSFCGKEKNLDEFNFKDKSKGTRQRHCRTCTRLQIRNHYLSNRKYYLDKAKKRNLEIRRVLNDYVFGYLNTHPCVDCGESDPVILEFDHVMPKFKDVARLKKDNSLGRLKDEISKCEVRCANCHRRKTKAWLNAKIKRLPP